MLRHKLNKAKAQLKRAPDTEGFTKVIPRQSPWGKERGPKQERRDTEPKNKERSKPISPICALPPQRKETH